MRLREALILALALASANAASATTWHNGDVVSYSESAWGDEPDGTNAASILVANYPLVYAPFGIFEVGTGFSMTFGGYSTLLDYLPAIGTPGPLDTDLLDPMFSSSGGFGGNVSALKLDVDFADANVISGTSGLKFGDLRVYGLTTTPDLNNMRVRDALAVLQGALGGGPTSDSYDALNSTALELSGAFFEGTPSTFAQDHLQAPVPEPSMLLLLVSGVAVVAARRSRVRPT